MRRSPADHTQEFISFGFSSSSSPLRHKLSAKEFASRGVYGRSGAPILSASFERLSLPHLRGAAPSTFQNISAVSIDPVKAGNLQASLHNARTAAPPGGRPFLCEHPSPRADGSFPSSCVFWVHQKVSRRPCNRFPR